MAGLGFERHIREQWQREACIPERLRTIQMHQLLALNKVPNPKQVVYVVHAKFHRRKDAELELRNLRMQRKMITIGDWLPKHERRYK
jgi:hypothetical protein